MEASASIAERICPTCAFVGMPKWDSECKECRWAYTLERGRQRQSVPCDKCGTTARKPWGACVNCTSIGRQKSAEKRSSRPCVRCGNDDWTPSNRCRYCITVKNKAWVARTPDVYLRKRRGMYNMKPGQMEAMLADQKNLCAICGQPERITTNGVPNTLCVDHCHTTGKVRGLLCRNCNTALGRFEDSSALMKLAIEYLQSPPAWEACSPYTLKAAHDSKNWSIRWRHEYPLKHKQLVDEQHNSCAICLLPETLQNHGNIIALSVDHCHETGRVRGLLCHRCNVAIGCLQDRTSIIQAGVDYLNKWADASHLMQTETASI